jgi:adenylate cyclase
MTADVFVSYARDDLPRVKPLVGMLEAQGWSVFWDRQILPGQPWSSLIEEKLTAAKAVVVVWSRTSVQSEWV